MSVYICADMSVFDDKAAMRRSMTTEEYVQSIIKNWNLVVGEEDYVALLGKIGGGNYEEMKGLFDQLNGSVLILDFDEREGNSRLSREQWNELGIQTYRFNSTIRGEIRGVNQLVHILCWNDMVAKSLGYCATAGSIMGTDKLFEDNTLNLSIEKWGYMPVRYGSVPKLINNAILLEEN